MRTSRKYRFWRSGIAAAVVLAATTPAPAFYWSLRVTPTVIEPKDRDKPGNPPLPGAEPIPLPPGPILPPGGPGSPPGTVPEPATAAVGLIGLGLVGVRRLLRKK